MTDINVGDEIVVEYRGVVSRTEYDGEAVRLNARNPLAPVFLDLSKADEVRVTRVADPVVGDVLTSIEEMDRLPSGSILVGIRTGDAFQKLDSGDYFRRNRYGNGAEIHRPLG